MARASPAIRPATVGDLAAIQAIYNDEILHGTATWDEEPWPLAKRRAWFAEHDALSPVLVAECAGRFAGFAYLSPCSPKSGWRFSREDTIYIDKEMRGAGVGTRLLAALLEEARRLDLNLIIASITSDNEASLTLHAHAGFEVVGTHRQAGFKFGRWLDTTLMQRVLREG
jgi:L-amino acid N-acyltransferase YncA